jgi:acetolactate synthase-1/2/3 large subunit
MHRSYARGYASWVARAARTRIGGHLVVESLRALGAEVAFGLPGIHALPIWEALRESEIRDLPFRTELAAGFAADGYARVTGRPAPLLLSTGPGALISLAALMEAASSHVPVVAIASQIPSELLGKGRGYLHELRDQAASFAPVVKLAATARSAEEIPALLAEAWRAARTPPTGPVFVEIPTDLLAAPADAALPDLDGSPPAPACPDPAALAEAARVLNGAARPVLVAGGGVLRSGAWEELCAVAERLDAPVLTTHMGKGAIPEDHPLAVGSQCDDGGYAELLDTADAVLAIGTELGAETTRQYAFRPAGRLIHLDAAAERIGATYEALGLVGDAAATLAALLPLLEPASRGGPERARAARERIARGLAESGAELELGLLQTIRAALPREAVHAWDMTILAYCASAHFPALAPRRFLYPLGSGTLGYAWPAALGAAAALPETPVLAVHGDGGVAYGLQELASARQHGLAAALLIVDDAAYGILRAYQEDAFGETHAVDLVQPDFLALAAAYGVPAREVSPETLGDGLAWALAAGGPAVLVLRAALRWIAPTP